MKNLETNKIAAAILLAGLIALTSGKIADFLYHPQESETRGFKVEVATEESATGDVEKEEEVVDIAALMANASSDNGAKLFKKCAACHGTEKGGANKVGPNLYGVLGAAKAHHAGYAYSSALKEKGGNWGYNELFEFLKKPKDFAPGTKMTFAGIKKPAQIADIVAYLRTHNDTPPALPAK
jgi:cytochrome c